MGNPHNLLRVSSPISPQTQPQAPVSLDPLVVAITRALRSIEQRVTTAEPARDSGANEHEEAA